MKYFSPETSKKLEEMGLKTATWNMNDEGKWSGEYNTLDICEIENAKKLWGETLISTDVKLGEQKTWHLYARAFEYQTKLEEYITLSDEERVQYIEDYLYAMDR